MSKRGNVKRKIFLNDYRGQVWIETVIYLLIAFVMMGLVLSFIRPKIEELKDKATIEQSLQILKDIDHLILTMGSPGNKRLVEVGIRKGSLFIDSEKDMIVFQMDSRYIYTEPGEVIQIGNIQALTKTIGKSSNITLTRDFSSAYNITYKNGENFKTLGKASAPYRIFFTNEGEVSNKIKINFDIE